MTFISIAFLLFFIVTFILMLIFKGRTQRQIILLATSYFFYAYWDARYLLLLIFQTLICYIFAKIIDKRKILGKNSKGILTIGIWILILVLGVFKYYNFFIDSFCNAFNLKNAGSLTIILPLGISFYTFQAISYIIDVYRGTVQVRKSLLKVSLFIAFFPQIVSGPINRSTLLLPQFDEDRRITKSGFMEGIQIFVFGLAKKVVIADRLAVCVDTVFSTPAAYNAPTLILAVLSYSIQIYCDFSGYSDMAIGVAKILGYDLTRNFNIPYLSKNPSEFWRRWHISLSSWFKDYVYIPLGGSRKGKFRTYFNLFITMLLSGLWHGANWNFVFWGALFGLSSIIYKIFCNVREKYNLSFKNKRLVTLANASSILGTFLFVSFCWIFFRADSFQSAFEIISRIATNADGISYIYIYTIIYGLLILFIHIHIKYTNNSEGKYHILNLGTMKGKILFCLAIGFIMMFFYVGNTAFIYSHF